MKTLQINDPHCAHHPYLGHNYLYFYMVKNYYQINIEVPHFPTWRPMIFWNCFGSQSLLSFSHSVIAVTSIPWSIINSIAGSGQFHEHHRVCTRWLYRSHLSFCYRKPMSTNYQTQQLYREVSNIAKSWICEVNLTKSDKFMLISCHTISEVLEICCRQMSILKDL